MNVRTTAIATVLSTLVVGCAGSKNGGPTATTPVDSLGAKPVDTATFRSVATNCTCFVDIQVGPKHHVEVSAREEVLADVKIEVEDDILKLEYLPTSTKYARDPVRFTVTLPELRALDAKVVTVVDVTGVEGGSLSVSADGASRVALGGSVQKLGAELHGHARLDAQKLEATDVELTVEGRGQAEVSARELLRADVHRFGKVWYHGDPKALDVGHGRRRVRPG